MSVLSNRLRLNSDPGSLRKSSLEQKFIDDGIRGEYADKLMFVGACYQAAYLNAEFYSVAGDTLEETATAEQALDQSLSVLTSIQELIEQELNSSRQWNVAAAGKGEHILAECQRNSKLIASIEEKLS